MSGYIYVLSNESMPGLLKIGKTERDPEERAKEITASTGVPSPFKVSHYVYVDDHHSVEALIHNKLEQEGKRHSKAREFFSISLDEAIVILDSFKSGLSFEVLWSRLQKIPRPSKYEPINCDQANDLEDKIYPLADSGLYFAFYCLASIFLENFPDQLKYRRYYLDGLYAEYDGLISLKSRDSLDYRAELGKKCALFIEDLFEKNWFGDHDFNSIQKFILTTDSHVYEGYVAQVNRSCFPASLRERALNI